MRSGNWFVVCENRDVSYSIGGVKYVTPELLAFALLASNAVPANSDRDALHIVPEELMGEDDV